MYSPDVVPMCCVCIYSKPIAGTDDYMCNWHGAVPERYKCRKFKYDIRKKTLRRKKMNASEFSPEDFSID